MDRKIMVSSTEALARRRPAGHSPFWPGQAGTIGHGPACWRILGQSDPSPCARPQPVRSGFV